MKFYIVNQIDKPHPPLVAYETASGSLNYLDRTKSEYDGMSKDRATPLEDFGFDIQFGYTEIFFAKERPSVARYDDGTIREWQGDLFFSRPFDKIGDSI